jgi:hypothetical protein
MVSLRSLVQICPTHHCITAALLVDPGMAAASLGSEAPKEAYILQDPKIYDDRATPWNSYTWDQPAHIGKVKHKSWPHHDGCPTLVPLLFSRVNSGAQDQMEKFQTQRVLSSPLEELVFYWTIVASNSLIMKTNMNSSHTAYYFLKYVAQQWTSQLELINCTVAKGEYFSDDFQANQVDIGAILSGDQWKAAFLRVNGIIKDIKYMSRQMNHFWRPMVLNLERRGIQLGD